MITIVVVLALLVAFVALLAYSAAALYLADAMTRPKRCRVEGTPADVQLRHEEVTFPAADGILLCAWYLDSPGARTTVVLVHDTDGTRSDPNHGLLQLQRDYVRSGLNVLSFDLRGRGESSGGRDYLGAAELADVAGAVTYARHRTEGSPIVLHGFGLGAALSLVATSRGLPTAAIIADSPFASTRAYLQLRHARVPGHLFALAALFAHRFFDADVDAVSPIQAMPHLGASPVLFIHGEHSRAVPIEDTLNLAAASLNAGDEIWRVPGAGHCGAYVADPIAYRARCLAFVASAVPARLPVASAV